MFVPRSNHGAYDKVTTEYSEMTEYTESLERIALTVHMVRMPQTACKLRKKWKQTSARNGERSASFIALPSACSVFLFIMWLTTSSHDRIAVQPYKKSCGEPLERLIRSEVRHGLESQNGFFVTAVAVTSHPFLEQD